MFGIGAGEFILIMIVGLIVFGPSKLPEIGRSLGKLISEFKKAQVALTTTLTETDEPPKVQKAIETKVEETKSKAQSIEEVTEMINANPISIEKVNLSKETVNK